MKTNTIVIDSDFEEELLLDCNLKALISFIENSKPHPYNRLKIYMTGGMPSYDSLSSPTPLFINGIFETKKHNQIVKMKKRINEKLDYFVFLKELKESIEKSIPEIDLK